MRRALDLADEVRDVDPTVHRKVWPEATAGLLELALTPDSVPAACLVPGDGDVHESLEEVSLGGLGGSPNILEDFVRGEVLAALDQFEPALEIRERL